MAHIEEPFGAGLHVRTTEPAWTGPTLLAALERAGAGGLHVEAAEPSLEDVFLAVAAR